MLQIAAKCEIAMVSCAMPTLFEEYRRDVCMYEVYKIMYDKKPGLKSSPSSESTAQYSSRSTKSYTRTYFTPHGAIS